MKLGIIGGSGLYDIEDIEDVEEREIETPFGNPSDSYICGKLNGHEVFFLPRHGHGHVLLPAEINHRANIYGFKVMGVDRVVSISAVGSLREELRPGDIVLPDQYFDRTKASGRHTFFGNGLVGHVAFGDPTCDELRGVIAESVRAVLAADEGSDVRLEERGTYVNMEGPAFSTRAEANVHRQLGFDVVGMTGMGEARLCREAELCYQSIAMVTDYDCWREAEEAVSVDMVIGTLMANTKLAKQILKKLVDLMPDECNCRCSSALAHALMTAPEQIADDVKERLEPIIRKYIT
jgi:5'-methylthioadenosine phosphorylase